MSQTPMMQQYQRVKSQYPDMILLFRMGDFYEMFYEDAKIAARLLGLTLTSRSKGERAVPMAGVPFHSVHSYVKRLIRAGHKVAICDQVEDPRRARGLVDRQVTRVITPGTLTEDALLESKEPNYLAALVLSGQEAGLAWVELSTGQFEVQDLSASKVVDELVRRTPSEVLVPEGLASEQDGLLERLRQETGAMITPRPEWTFGRDTAERALLEHFGVRSLEGFGIGSPGASLSAAGAALLYLQETQKVALAHIRRLSRTTDEDRVILDRSTQIGLEITRTSREGQRHGSLLWALDRTLTPMGGRLLREWVTRPLRDPCRIGQRLDAVEELVGSPALRREIRSRLKEVYDVERLTARVATGRANARDLLALCRSLEAVPLLRERLAGAGSAPLRRMAEGLDPVEEARTLIGAAIAPDPAPTLREGRIIRDGYSAELDELRSLQRDGRQWIARYQAREMERTGIPSLKVGYNQVFGYYIEVTHTHQEKVPPDYIRKQTLKNAERYITPELKEYETRVLTAQERAQDIEYDLFVKVRETVAGYTERLQHTAGLLAELDALASLADVASEYHYVRPEITQGREIEIRSGRHPVLERTAPEPFVPNDTTLDGERTQMMILTGPNMAGKSTYIRQVALIVLMAHMGSFVPADSARVGLVDRIFTRIGAADELSRGQSTFMVEMIETANILHNATDRSLIIFDEVGRGTSTFDGVSIAWAVAEYVVQHLKSRTLFATHYHELTELSALYDSIRNYNILVREWQDEVIFLRKVVKGGTDKSYGIHVARLAGVPREVVERAKEVLANLESLTLDDENRPRFALSPGAAGRGGRPGQEARSARRRERRPIQLTLFGSESDLVADALRKLDISTLTPLQALNKLEELKRLLAKSDGDKPSA